LSNIITVCSLDALSGHRLAHSGMMAYNSTSAKQSTCTSYERSRCRESVLHAEGIL